MEVKDVAGIRFAAGRTAQQERDLTVRLRMLRQVVVHAQRVAAAVAEVLAHRARRVGADIQQRCGVRRARRDHDRVLHRAGVLENPHHLGDRGLLLSDRVVDADDVLPLLVDDRVHRNGGLAGLAVADDQLALSPANRHHRVDRLQAGLQRLLDGAAIDDAGSHAFDRRELLRRDRAFAVDRLPQSVHDAADEFFADRHGNDAPRALDGVSLTNLGVVAEEHRPHTFFFQVERDPVDAVREFEHLARHRIFDPVHARDAVADRHDGADFRDVDVHGVAADLIANNLGDFFRFDVHYSLVRGAVPWCLSPLAFPLSGSGRRQRLFHLLQLARDAAIVDCTADPCDRTADDRRIDAGLELHLPARRVC